MIALLVTGIELSAAAGLTSGQINLLKAVPGKVIRGMTWNGQAIVPAGGSPAAVNNGGASSANAASANAVPTMEQLQAAITQNPASVAKAAMQALQSLELDMASAQPSTVAAAYIAS